MTTSHARTALITGASRGLGRALARQLAREGWTLVIDARGTHELEEVQRELAHATSVTAIVGDITDAAHRQTLVKAVQGIGLLDALINNASILFPVTLPAAGLPYAIRFSYSL